VTSTPDLLRQWDRDHYEPSGEGLTLSRLGGCRRQAGYLLSGEEPSDPERSESADGRPAPLQDVIGSAIHRVVEEAARAGAEPGDLIEHRVNVAGLAGRLDRYHAATRTVVDVKTVHNRIPKVRAFGPKRQELWQINANAAGLILAGVRVDRVRIDYIDRANGETYEWSAPVNPDVLRQALEWVREVRASDVQWLPRDHNATSQECSWCPFRSKCWAGGLPNRAPETVLFLEHPQAREWVEELLAAKADKADAEEREERAKAALDALRPDGTGPHTVVTDDGARIRYTYVRGRLTAPREQVEAYYAAHGDPSPYTRGDGYWKMTASVDA
jgi:CRISPR/Cas system-associated exonuclease Cas4 (RecB family)